MAPYVSLAPCYDRLTSDVDYRAWADFYETVFKLNNLNVRSILDLACGTGTLSYILARRGYEVIGTDASADMLAMALSKAPEDENMVLPMFLNQTMQGLDLYGTVDAAVCCLDGINYLPSLKEVAEAFRRVHLFLNPGGIFIFDVNTPFKLRKLDGQVFLDEQEGLYCVWRASFDESERACYYGIDIFTQTGKLWRRDFEEHVEYAYTPEELKKALETAGFSEINIYGELSLRPPKEDEERIFITARKMMK